jgi:capsular exopolysaccharide synthesis family protein
VTAETTTAFLRRWAWLLVLGGVLAAAASYAVSVRSPKVYAAQTKVLVLPSDVNGQNADPSQVQGLTGLARTYVEVVRTQPVLEAAIRTGNLNLTSDEASSLISVTQIPNTQLLQIAAKSSDPVSAANLANLVADAFIRQVQQDQSRRYTDAEQSLSTELDQIDKQLSESTVQLSQLQAQPAGGQRDTDMAQVQLQVNQLQLSAQDVVRNYSDLRLASARSRNLFTIVEPATPPPAAQEPRVSMNVLMAVVVGLLLGLGVALAGDRLDQRLNSARDVKRATKLPLLGTVARSPDRGTLSADSSLAEYGQILAEARLVADRGPLRTLLVTSAESGDGRSTTARHLAIAAAQAGESVVLVESDLRRPDLHMAFNVSNARGLTSLLLDDQLPAGSALEDSGIAGLRLLPSGPTPSQPSQLLASRRMTQRLAELEDLAELVILDSPPLLVGTDAAYLARQVDYVLLLIDVASARKGRLGEALSVLQRAGARVLGTVINRQPAEDRGFFGAPRGTPVQVDPATGLDASG